MRITLEKKVEPKDIRYPKTLVIEELGILAVFRSVDDCIVCAVDPAVEDKMVLVDQVEVPIKAMLGKRYRGISANKDFNDHNWAYAAEEGLLWNIENRLVGWQDGDEVIIVDSAKEEDSRLTAMVSVEDYDWNNVTEFCDSLELRSEILVSPIKDEEVVLFTYKNELDEYMRLTTDANIETQTMPLFPFVIGKNISFSMSNTAMMLANKAMMSRLISYKEWKATRI